MRAVNATKFYESFFSKYFVPDNNIISQKQRSTRGSIQVCETKLKCVQMVNNRHAVATIVQKIRGRCTRCSVEGQNKVGYRGLGVSFRRYGV